MCGKRNIVYPPSRCNLPHTGEIHVYHTFDDVKKMSWCFAHFSGVLIKGFIRYNTQWCHGYIERYEASTLDHSSIVWTHASQMMWTNVEHRRGAARFIIMGDNVLRQHVRETNPTPWRIIIITTRPSLHKWGEYDWSLNKAGSMKKRSRHTLNCYTYPRPNTLKRNFHKGHHESLKHDISNNNWNQLWHSWWCMEICVEQLSINIYQWQGFPRTTFPLD